MNQKRVCQLNNSYKFLKIYNKKNKANSYDENFFFLLLEGVDKNKTDIQNLIEKNLSDKWNYDRIDITLKAILSLGVFELQSCREIPLKVVINEYVTISKMFFNSEDTGFINGMLDNIGKKVRVNE